jgi:histidyl-tRNA synthetase
VENHAQTPVAERYAERVAETLRDGGLSVVLHCGGGGFKAQMKRADGSGARYAVVIGDDEAAAGTVTVKALRENVEQVRVNITEAREIIRRGGKDR